MTTAASSDFDDLVKAIAKSYAEEPRTKNIDAGTLPSRDAVIEIIHLLQELLFPGYFGKLDLDSRTLEYHIGDLLIGIHAKLTEQVENAIRHQTGRSGEKGIDTRTQAERIVHEFLAAIPELRRVLATDVQAAYDFVVKEKNIP